MPGLSCGSGGTGATAATPATDGGDAIGAQAPRRGGGGGGGLGRLRVNTLSGAFTRASGSTIEASVTSGAITTL